ncbi:LysR family transcriptional regulator [Paraeggerthella hongkongensis]|uniref:HTH lysR-type domain-containing protein n=1 Tax=Paraeggerthella hongkongensis TaxID=230658 RepID=A0A3N0BDY5_9ACTN|nr:LysR family transcriptional regulator [Paraeggerthella hongkongensis]RNL46003.1 hypothetical protein DMP08_04645 [Paraeggerthella hongkongensis]
MNINHIKFFVKAYEEGSFSAAARAGRMSVQNVSKTMFDLEEEIGCLLFDRTTQGVVPTEAGRAFYVRAQLAVRAFDLCERFSIEGGGQGICHRRIISLP